MTQKWIAIILVISHISAPLSWGARYEGTVVPEEVPSFSGGHPDVVPETQAGVSLTMRLSCDGSPSSGQATLTNNSTMSAVVNFRGADTDIEKAITSEIGWGAVNPNTGLPVSSSKVLTPGLNAKTTISHSPSQVRLDVDSSDFPAYSFYDAIIGVSYVLKTKMLYQKVGEHQEAVDKSHCNALAWGLVWGAWLIPWAVLAYLACIGPPTTKTVEDWANTQVSCAASVDFSTLNATQTNAYYGCVLAGAAPSSPECQTWQQMVDSGQVPSAASPECMLKGNPTPVISQGGRAALIRSGFACGI